MQCLQRAGTKQAQIALTSACMHPAALKPGLVFQPGKHSRVAVCLRHSPGLGTALASTVGQILMQQIVLISEVILLRQSFTSDKYTISPLK